MAYTEEQIKKYAEALDTMPPELANQKLTEMQQVGDEDAKAFRENYLNIRQHFNEGGTVKDIKFIKEYYPGTTGIPYKGMAYLPKEKRKDALVELLRIEDKMKPVITDKAFQDAYYNEMLKERVGARVLNPLKLLTDAGRPWEYAVGAATSGIKTVTTGDGENLGTIAKDLFIDEKDFKYFYEAGELLNKGSIIGLLGLDTPLTNTITGFAVSMLDPVSFAGMTKVGKTLKPVVAGAKTGISNFGKAMVKTELYKTAAGKELYGDIINVIEKIARTTSNILHTPIFEADKRFKIFMRELHNEIQAISETAVITRAQMDSLIKKTAKKLNMPIDKCKKIASLYIEKPYYEQWRNIKETLKGDFESYADKGKEMGKVLPEMEKKLKFLWDEISRATNPQEIDALRSAYDELSSDWLRYDQMYWQGYPIDELLIKNIKKQDTIIETVLKDIKIRKYKEPIYYDLTGEKVFFNELIKEGEKIIKQPMVGEDIAMVHEMTTSTPVPIYKTVKSKTPIKNFTEIDDMTFEMDSSVVKKEWKPKISMKTEENLGLYKIKIKRPAISPEIEKAADIAAKANELAISSEIDAGIDIMHLSNLEYLKHAMTQKAKDVLKNGGFTVDKVQRTITDAMIISGKGAHKKIFHGSQLNRVFLPDEPAESINQIVRELSIKGALPKEFAEKNIDFFITDPSVLTAMRVEQAGKAVAQANIMNKILRPWDAGGLSKPLNLSPEDLVSLKKLHKVGESGTVSEILLKQTDKRYEGFYVVRRDATPYYLEEIAPANLMNYFDGDKWATIPYIIDRKAAGQFNKLTAIIYPGQEKWYDKVISEINNRVKSMLLLAPSWHRLNMASNIIDLGLEGGKASDLIDSGKFTFAARKYVKYGDEEALKNLKIKIAQKGKEGRYIDGLSLWKEMSKRNVRGSGIFHNPIADYWFESMADDGLKGKIYKIGRSVDILGNPRNFLYKGNYHLGALEDNTARTALFIRKLRQGNSFDDAANAVNKIFFDYSDVPEWMQGKWGRGFLFPFITWSAKNTAKYAGRTIKDPKYLLVREKILQAIHYKEKKEVKKVFPEYMKLAEGTAIDYDKKTGEATITMFERSLPWNALKDLYQTVTSTVQGDWKKTLMAQMTNPALKVPFEILAEKDFFTGKEFDPDAEEPVFLGLTYVSPESAHILHQVRILKILDKIATQNLDKPIWQRVSNEIWGNWYSKRSVQSMANQRGVEIREFERRINKDITQAIKNGRLKRAQELQDKLENYYKELSK